LKNLSAIALTFCVIALPVRVSFAQSKTATPSPLAPTVAPAAVYESPFAGFVPLTEPTVSPASTWREVNKAVGSYDSMSATMDDMPGMAMPAGHDMKSMLGTDKKAMPEGHDMKSMPMGHDMKSMPMNHDMPMGHDMKAMPKHNDMKSMPMNHDMPTGHDMKNMSKTQDVNATPKSKDLPMSHDMKAMPKGHDMKTMPMNKDMPMNMDMPGMKEMK
jgi:hypothetical protein